MDEDLIIANALFDVLDAMGAMTKPHEIDSEFGTDQVAIDNVYKARELLIQRGIQGAS